jgi:hypothetical protein
MYNALYCHYLQSSHDTSLPDIISAVLLASAGTINHTVKAVRTFPCLFLVILGIVSIVAVRRDCCYSFFFRLLAVLFLLQLPLTAKGEAS